MACTNTQQNKTKRCHTHLMKVLHNVGADVASDHRHSSWLLISNYSANLAYFTLTHKRTHVCMHSNAMYYITY